MIAAIYARKSTDQKDVADDQKSVARQVEHARAYAERQGWTVADESVYVDDGISGAEFAKRPAFLRLLNALTPQPRFQALIVSELSRLGREQLETGYAMKQLAEAGVRVHCYLEGREVKLESATDKFLLAAVNFAAEVEREKARQRAWDAMQRKALAGHVTGGRVFGYDNIEVGIVGADGTGRARHSHVERRINEGEAAVVRQIFQLCADGFGQRKIAITLNDEGARPPRPQQGRPSAWSTSAVWEILRRPLYRGTIVWNRTRKRNAFGKKKPAHRPETDHIIVQVEALRVVSEELWRAAHERLARARAVHGPKALTNPWQRPPSGGTTKYLLSGLSRCAVCGCGFRARSRAQGSTQGRFRAYAYGCTGHFERGNTVCRNGHLVPMGPADAAVIAMLAEDLDRPHILEAAVLEAADGYLAGTADDQAGVTAQADLDAVEGRLANLVAVAAAGADVPAIVGQLRVLEARRLDLVARLADLRGRDRPVRIDRHRLVATLRERIADWRALLARETPVARHLLETVLADRILITPQETADGPVVELRARLAYDRLFSGVIPCAEILASPTGLGTAFLAEKRVILPAA